MIGRANRQISLILEGHLIDIYIRMGEAVRHVAGATSFLVSEESKC
jgi:hypothetical protein